MIVVIVLLIFIVIILGDINSKIPKRDHVKEAMERDQVMSQQKKRDEA